MLTKARKVAPRLNKMTECYSTKRPFVQKSKQVRVAIQSAWVEDNATEPERRSLPRREVDKQPPTGIVLARPSLIRNIGQPAADRYVILHTAALICSYQ